MEFKSQIATTREQSEVLLSLGLKPETADMVYHHTNSRVKSLEWELQTKPPTLRGKFWTPERIAKLKSPFHKHPDGTLMTGEEIFDCLWGKDVPAWSLDRLLEIIPKSIYQNYHPNADFNMNSDGKFWFVSYEELGYDVKYQEMDLRSFDAVIRMIECLIKNNHLNPEYLKK